MLLSHKCRFVENNNKRIFRHSCQTLTKQHFHDIHLPEKDIHRPFHQMGFVHFTQIQNKSHPHAHLSLLPNLLLCSSASLLQSALVDLRKRLLQNGYPQVIITFLRGGAAVHRLTISTLVST